MPMPNPTPQTSTTPSSPTVLQNGVQDQNSVKQQNNTQQKIAEILANITARLDNVTNLRTGTQSAVYDAFGNNFITRGATQLTDSIFDSVDTLFGKKEEPKEDPILKELKAHTIALANLGNLSGNYTELIDLNKSANEIHEMILRRLDRMGLENHEFYNENITLLEEQLKISQENLTSIQSLLKIQPSISTSSQHQIVDRDVIVDPNIIDIDVGDNAPTQDYEEPPKQPTVTEPDLKSDKSPAPDSNSTTNNVNDMELEKQPTVADLNTKSTSNTSSQSYDEGLKSSKQVSSDPTITVPDITSVRPETTSQSSDSTPTVTKQPTVSGPVNVLLSDADSTPTVTKQPTVSDREVTVTPTVTKQPTVSVADSTPTVTKQPTVSDREVKSDDTIHRDHDDTTFSKSVTTPDVSITDVVEKSSRDTEDKSVKLLSTISSTLLNMSKLMQKLFASESLSSQETDLENSRKTDKSIITNVIDKSPLKSSDTKDINVDTSFFGKVIGGIIAGITALLTFFNSDKIKMLMKVFDFFKSKPSISVPDVPSKGDIPTKMPSPSSNVPDQKLPKSPTPSGPKSSPIPSNGGAIGKAKSIMKGAGKIVGKWTIPAIIAGTAGMAIDSVAGVAGVGDKEVNIQQDDTNWDRMSNLQKVESGIGRTIEKTGEFFGFSNFANEAKSTRIQKETDYLDNQLSLIDQKQKDIDTEMKNRLVSSNRPTRDSSVNRNTVINNSTVMPIRESVKNTDNGLNRYLNSIFS